MQSQSGKQPIWAFRTYCPVDKIMHDSEHPGYYSVQAHEDYSDSRICESLHYCPASRLKVNLQYHASDLNNIYSGGELTGML